jgi:dTDP-4-dehydrorhamnose reductase
MRWLVTGAGGQLGSHLVSLLGPSAVGVTRADLDITSLSAVRACIADVRPYAVVNAAAWTGVDAAESEESASFAVNATAVGHLASVAGARLIHVSTDYVFAGAADRPYEVDDEPAPRTAYGRTKLAGELLALEAGATVVRTAWVYGGPGPNFVDTMLRLAGERDFVDVVSDQIGSPTWVRDLAAGLIALGPRGGLFHFVNSGQASWCDLARATFALRGHDPARVRPVPTSAVARPAPRPAWSVLSTASWTAAGLPAPRSWQDALSECLQSRDA